MIEQCKNCKYCVEEDVIKKEWSPDLDKQVEVITGQRLACHRYAPRMINGAGAGWSDWAWPEVKATDWCGEWVWLPREEN